MTSVSGPSSVPESSAAKTLDTTKELRRFDVVERLVHWSLAIMVLILIVTGSTLYFPSLALRVGHRALIAQIHVTTGLSLFLPLIVGLAGPWRKPLRADLRRLDRWGTADFHWFRRRERLLGLPRDKFNGGQKLVAAIFGGTLAAALVTGAIMRYAPPSWATFATGATLVHDALFFAIVVTLVAHIVSVLARPARPKSMLKGQVSRSRARKSAQAWLSEVDAPSDGASQAGTTETAVDLMVPAPGPEPPDAASARSAV